MPVPISVFQASVRGALRSPSGQCLPSGVVEEGDISQGSTNMQQDSQLSLVVNLV